MGRHRRWRGGLTLIELLVVIAVIGILSALLIPAVLMARSAASRSTCANNLRQIGLALHSYESSERSFPTATSGYPSSRSFLVALLPHLEQRPLYDSINFEFDLARASPANRTSTSTTVEVFLCPSDTEGKGRVPTATNYVGNQGSGVQKYGYNGMFQVIMPVRMQEVTDGASHTAAVSEWAIGPRASGVRHPIRSVFRTSDHLIEPDELDQFAAACDQIDIATAPLYAAPKGMNWLFGDFGYSLYNHVLKPNKPTCINGTAHQQGAWTAGGFHNAGLNLLLADGNVRFVRDSVDLAVWRAVASRNGGELVTLDP